MLLICDKPASFGFGGRWVVGNVWYHEDIDEYGQINVNTPNEGDISFIDTVVQPHMGEASPMNGALVRRCRED